MKSSEKRLYKFLVEMGRITKDEYKKHTGEEYKK